MKFGIFCVVILMCVVVYALMDTAKDLMRNQMNFGRNI